MRATGAGFRYVRRAVVRRRPGGARAALRVWGEMAMSAVWSSVLPSAETARRYRAQGWWRDTTFADDLRDAAAADPDATALLTWRQREGRVLRLTFGEFDARADAVAGALHERGVRRGDVVAFQLPPWWETAVLILACLRVGAVVSPLSTRFGPYEVARALAGTGAVACVVPDAFDGVPHARRLAEQAARLPALRHRIVVGDAAATGAISWDDCCAGRPSLPRGCQPLGPDDVSALLFTSGTTSETKLVVRSCNTLWAGMAEWPRLAAGDVVATTGSLGHNSGFRQLLRTVALRVPTVYSDSRDAGRWLRLIEETGATQLVCPPQKLRALVAEQRRAARDLSGLRTVHSLGGPLPPVLLTAVREVLCPVVVNTWGMSEASNMTSTDPADPPHRAGESLGRVHASAQVRLDPAGDDVFRLSVRGPAVCLATVGRDSGRLHWSAAQDDGWLDTGDLVTHDGADGLRFVGRVAERIGDPDLIPVADVENALLTHPAVQDVVLLPWPGTDGREAPCAAVISPAAPPSVQELRDHLTALGFHESCLPVRVEHVTDFPRTELGKVRRTVLLGRLRQDTGQPAAGPQVTD